MHDRTRFFQSSRPTSLLKGFATDDTADEVASVIVGRPAGLGRQRGGAVGRTSRGRTDQGRDSAISAL